MPTPPRSSQANKTGHATKWVKSKTLTSESTVLVGRIVLERGAEGQIVPAIGLRSRPGLVPVLGHLLPSRSSASAGEDPDDDVVALLAPPPSGSIKLVMGIRDDPGGTHHLLPTCRKASGQALDALSRTCQ